MKAAAPTYFAEMKIEAQPCASLANAPDASGLLGLRALRKNRAVLDANANNYFSGPGGYGLE